jgi:hypothetical protein
MKALKILLTLEIVILETKAKDIGYGSEEKL